MSLLALLPALCLGQLFYSTNNGLITITGYNGTQTTINIPTSINDHPVNAIGDWAFAGNQTVEVIEIPNGVESIGASAFANCPSLRSAPLPPSIAGIGDGAFAGCSSLKYISVPVGITSIAVATFAHSGLTNISLPPSITRIWNNAFYQCTNLTSFQMPPAVTNLGSFAFYGCSSLATVSLPAGLQSMETGAFIRCYQLSEVLLAPGLTLIGAEAFDLCTNLTHIVIPASVTNLGDYAFYGCENLRAVCFQGNPPAPGYRLYYNSSQVISYYLASSTGWGATYAERPTALWHQNLQFGGNILGLAPNGFSFDINGPPSLPITIEAASAPVGTSWIPLQSCTLTNGSIRFNDSQWTNHPTRFYRLRSP